MDLLGDLGTADQLIAGKCCVVSCRAMALCLRMFVCVLASILASYYFACCLLRVTTDY